MLKEWENFFNNDIVFESINNQIINKKSNIKFNNNINNKNIKDNNKNCNKNIFIDMNLFKDQKYVSLYKIKKVKKK